MEGRDLSLKKLWHLHTVKDQEKVRKAEQAQTQKERNLNDLCREVEEEKNREEVKRTGTENSILCKNGSGKKLDWMYKYSNELINREEYLLGRKIDKSFEVLQVEETERKQQNLVGVKQPLNHIEHECVPFSIRAYKCFENSEQVDLQRKVMEDPLMHIKQREMESRKKILENPVKLKELHRILKSDKHLRKISKKSKKHKKSKKKHKRSFSSSSTCKSDSDLDSKLAKKLKDNILNTSESSNLGFNLTKILDSELEKMSQELDISAGKSNHHHKKIIVKRSNSKVSNVSNQRTRYVGKYFKASSDDRKFVSTERRSRSVSAERRSKNFKQMPSPVIENDGVNKSSRKSQSKSKNRRKTYRSRSPSQSSSRVDFNRRQTTEKQKSAVRHPNNLTDEEKQSKLKEMMFNAAWREEKRTEVVLKHRESNAKEQSLASMEFDREFLNKEIQKAIASRSSVGSRLHANLNNIQKTPAAMNSNFARK